MPEATPQAAGTSGPPNGRPDNAVESLDAVLAERNRLWADAREAESLRLELAHARAITAEMQSSLSWRVTTPLRSGKRYSGRIKAGVRRRLGA